MTAIIVCSIIGASLLAIWIYLQVTHYKPGNKTPFENIEKTETRFNPDANRWAKSKAIENAGKNAELAAFLSIEMQSVLALMKTKTEAIIAQFDQEMAKVREEMKFSTEVLAHQKLLNSHERDMALLENERAVLTEASRLQLPASVYTELKMEEGKMKMRLFEEEQRARAELSAADFMDLSSYQQVEILTKRLETLRRERHGLLWGGDPPEVRDPIIKRYDRNIRALEKDIDTRNKGLIQAQNR